MSKVTLKELRKLIQEEIAQAHQDLQDLGSNDDDVDVGTDVAVAGPDGADVGKVVGRYAGTKGKGAVWTVKTGSGKTVQRPAEDLKPIEADKPGEVQKHVPKPEDEKGDADKLLMDKDLNEIDEKREEDDFKEKHYAFIAKQILFKWSSRSLDVSWKAVADNYVRATKASTGKVLDSVKLYDALQDALSEEEECKDRGLHDTAQKVGK